MLERKVTARQRGPFFLDHDGRYSAFHSRLARAVDSTSLLVRQSVTCRVKAKTLPRIARQGHAERSTDAQGGASVGHRGLRCLLISVSCPYKPSLSSCQSRLRSWS